MIPQNLVHQPTPALSPVCRSRTVALGSIMRPMNSSLGFHRNEGFFSTVHPLSGNFHKTRSDRPYYGPHCTPLKYIRMDSQGKVHRYTPIAGQGSVLEAEYAFSLHAASTSPTPSASPWKE
jgi:hypothetical protein